MCYDVSEGSRAGKSKNSAVVKSMRNYNHSKLICFAIRKIKISNFLCDIAWLKRVAEAKIFRTFVPCNHEGPCDDKTCSCVKNAFFCTKHCVWGKKSRNFYQGCSCNGKCNTNSCSCFAAKRECDPDVCKCDTCSDPPGQRATNQRCRNDNMSMCRRSPTIVAESSIENAGWGLYTKVALKRGDFVDEYIGKLSILSSSMCRLHLIVLNSSLFLFPKAK